MEQCVFSQKAHRQNWTTQFCKGDFASRHFEKSDFENEAASRIIAICRQSDGVTWSTYYAVLKRPRGGSQLVTLFSNKADSDTVSGAGERLTGLLQTGGSFVEAKEPENDNIPDREETPVKRY